MSKFGNAPLLHLASDSWQKAFYHTCLTHEW